jgi:hypothetical protein
MGRGGGGGGLRILPKKSWNVWNLKNRKKVAEDEAKYAAEQKKLEDKNIKEEKVFRLDVLRQRSKRRINETLGLEEPQNVPGRGEDDGEDGRKGFVLTSLILCHVALEGAADEAGAIEAASEPELEGDDHQRKRRRLDPNARAEEARESGGAGAGDAEAGAAASASASDESRAPLTHAQRIAQKYERAQQRAAAAAARSQQQQQLVASQSGSEAVSTVALPTENRHINFFADMEASARATTHNRNKEEEKKKKDIEALQKLCPTIFFGKTAMDESVPLCLPPLSPFGAFDWHLTRVCH